MSHGLPILRDLLLVAGVSLAVLGVFGRLRLPPAAGLVASGILLGPAGFGLVRDAGLVATLAEFGVMLLLFTVGLEFSVADFRRLGRPALIGGPLYVGLTSAAAVAVFVAAGVHPAPAILFGLLTALSSTAVVFRVLMDRAELGSPHGRWVTGVLVFQDLMVIPASIALPALARWYGAAPPPQHGGGALVQALTLTALAVMALASGRVVPWLVQRASRARSREAFLFGVVLVALGGAYAASLAGLSPALGAFVVGLILANSELRTQVEADVLPLRDMLASVFFVTIGMLLDRDVLLGQPVLVLMTTAGLLALKLVVGYLALRLAGGSGRVSFAAALALAQVGEFSFVLLQAAAPAGLVPPVGGQAFLAGAIVSLALTPWLVARAPEWAIGFDLRFSGMSGSGRTGARDADAEEHGMAHSTLHANHVIVAGFGLNGRNVARVLRAVHVPHLVVDLDPDALQQARRDGSPVLHGDVTKSTVMHHAGIRRARVLVLALSDPTATRHACRVARDLAPGLFVVVRTRHVAEIDGLYAVGANLVIPEEFETSIEIFTAVLRELHVPMNVVDAQIRLLRQERYGLMRGVPLPGSVLEQLDVILQEGTVETFVLLQQSPAIGATLGGLGMAPPGTAPAEAAPPAAVTRPAHAIAVVRSGRAITELDAAYELRVGDVLVLTGTHREMQEALRRLDPAREPDAARPAGPSPAAG